MELPASLGLVGVLALVELRAAGPAAVAEAPDADVTAEEASAEQPLSIDAYSYHLPLSNR